MVLTYSHSAKPSHQISITQRKKKTSGFQFAKRPVDIINKTRLLPKSTTVFPLFFITVKFAGQPCALCRRALREEGENG